MVRAFSNDSQSDSDHPQSCIDPKRRESILSKRQIYGSERRKRSNCNGGCNPCRSKKSRTAETFPGCLRGIYRLHPALHRQHRGACIPISARESTRLGIGGDGFYGTRVVCRYDLHPASYLSTNGLDKCKNPRASLVCGPISVNGASKSSVSSSSSASAT